MSTIGILGAGTWGIALARMLTLKGHAVTVWSALPAEIEALSRTRTQPNLPGMVIPEGTAFTDSLEAVCKNKDLLLFVVPSVFVRATARQAAPFIPEGQLIADAAKGIEPDTLLSMTEVIREEMRGKSVSLTALSGPTHAEEVARDLPTAIVSACEDLKCAERVQELMMTPFFRVYTNPDIRGVELCGAVKNIIALAAGISAGLGCGDNTRAALITRGMAEITRLGLAMGCREQTFAGLAGIGDLIVTATSRHSRNNRCGELIGKGVSPEEAVRQVGMVVEGINALPATMALAEKHHVAMPITRAVYAVIREGQSPEQAVRDLMTRDRKSELLNL